MSTFETPVRPDVQVPRGDILAALRAPPPSAVRAATPPHRPTKAQELEIEQERQAQALRELDALRLVFRGAHHRRGAFDEEEDWRRRSRLGRPERRADVAVARAHEDRICCFGIMLKYRDGPSRCGRGLAESETGVLARTVCRTF